MPLVAFDAGDFSRWKKVEGQKKTIFHTPLGVCVAIKEGKEEKFKEFITVHAKNL